MHSNAFLTRSSGGQPPFDSCARGRQVAKGVCVIDLAQYIIGQPDSIDLPPAMQRRSGGRTQLRRMIEVLVVRLEEAEMRYPELLDTAAGVPIRAKQNAVLVLQKE